MTMTTPDFENPLIVQSDKTILLDVHSPKASQARQGLAEFAELVKSPEHVHTYQISPLSIWNACAAGTAVDDMVRILVDFSKYPPPELILTDIRSLAGRYGSVILEPLENNLILHTEDPAVSELLFRDKKIGSFLDKRLTPLSFKVLRSHRGALKQALVELGYPASLDLARRRPSGWEEF